MLVGNDISNIEKLEIAVDYMKDHDSNKRIKGIKLYADIIRTEFHLLSSDTTHNLQLIFECEHDIDVLLQLSKLCTKLGLISLFKERICKINLNDYDYFDNNRHTDNVINSLKRSQAENQVYSNQNIHNSVSDQIDTVEIIISLIPILQDIAELDDIFVRVETLKSLKSLINMITFIIEDCIENHSDLYIHKLTTIFDKSLRTFQRLANSDIISHKILSCHIIPLILGQKRLCDFFNDDENILLTNYSDFCTHPATILRKHASKVFNLILDEIEFDEEMVDIFILPMIRNFCYDEQESVRILAIENIEGFFMQVARSIHLDHKGIQHIFTYFNKLQPYIFVLYNDINWRIRSVVSRPIINIYARLGLFESYCESENTGVYENLVNLRVELEKNEEVREKSNIEADENGHSNLSCNESDINMNFQKNGSENLCLDNNSISREFYKSDTNHLNKMTSILTQLLLDSENETRINTLIEILKFIEEEIYGIPNETINQLSISSKVLFFEVIVPQINDICNKFFAEQQTALKISLTKALKLIILIKRSASIDEHSSVIENAFSTLIARLISDSDAQVRQSTVLALCFGILELEDNDFLINNIIEPYSSLMVKDEFWRVRYSSILLLSLSLYKLLLNKFKEEDIWNGNIQENNSKDCSNNFFGMHKDIPNTIIELIIGCLSDKITI
ncbi:protein phosphatase 2A scaffold subunit, partial [Cryptosporidium felis]